MVENQHVSYLRVCVTMCARLQVDELGLPPEITMHARPANYQTFLMRHKK